MKKLLIFAAVLALAGTASATSLNWTINNVKTVASANTDSPANASGYLVMLFITEQTTSNTAADATLTSVEEIEGFIKAGTAIDDKYIAASKTTNNGVVSGATGYGGTAFQSGEKLTAFAVVFDATTQAAAENYFIIGAKEVTFGGTGATSLPFGSQANASKSFAPTSVPEPATGALALAGIALLFRRRK